MKKGFSLVELSIVLVILGLLTGGILAGQSLIHAAQLRSVTTDYMRYKAAAGAFRDKYFQLPGDMNNATSFWGSLGGTGADTTCQNTVATGTATCNGNGDGQISQSVSPRDERFRFWQHLANAGLIEGQYTGTAGTNSSGYTLPFVAGLNLPPSRMPNGAWGISYATNTTSATQFTYTGHMMQLFGPTSTATGYYPVISPEDAWNIDTKMDDGKPGTGSVMNWKGDGTTWFCTDQAGVAAVADSVAQYKLTNRSLDCGLFFVNFI